MGSRDRAMCLRIYPEPLHRLGRSFCTVLRCTPDSLPIGRSVTVQPRQCSDASYRLHSIPSLSTVVPVGDAGAGLYFMLEAA